MELWKVTMLWSVNVIANAKVKSAGANEGTQRSFMLVFQGRRLDSVDSVWLK